MLANRANGDGFDLSRWYTVYGAGLIWASIRQGCRKIVPVFDGCLAGVCRPHAIAPIIEGMARTFQITQLFGRLSVIENVMLALHPAVGGGLSMFRSMKGDRILRQHATDILARWQLSQIAEQTAQLISYGQKRQVDLMLALVGHPTVLLLDEPTAGLSAPEVVRVVDMIKSLPSDMTVLMIEHDMDIAFDLADRVTVMNQGQVMIEDDVAAIRNNAEVASIYLGEE